MLTRLNASYLLLLLFFNNNVIIFFIICHLDVIYTKNILVNKAFMRRSACIMNNGMPLAGTQHA